MAKQHGDAELTELTCRIQLGTQLNTLINELKIYNKYAELPEEHIFKSPKLLAAGGRTYYVLSSLEEKADEIRKVYEFYDKLCAEEFARIPTACLDGWNENAVRFEADSVLEYYRRERPKLFAGGVSDVPELNKSIKTHVTFLDAVKVTGGGSQQLIDALEAAKRTLDASTLRIGGIPIMVPGLGKILKLLIIGAIPKGKIGGWSPRSTPTNMAAHHVGQALDIEAETNPHLLGTAANAIDAVLDHLASKGRFPYPQRLRDRFIDWKAIEINPNQAATLAIEMHAKLTSISEAFRTFLKEILDKQKAKEPLDPVEQKIFKQCQTVFKAATLKKYSEQGIFDLSVLIAVLLLTHGFRWGAEFASRKEDDHLVPSKDQHHFQLRTFPKPFKTPKCVEQWQKKSSKVK